MLETRTARWQSNWRGRSSSQKKPRRSGVKGRGDPEGEIGADGGTRTRDILRGKQPPYQLGDVRELVDGAIFEPSECGGNKASQATFPAVFSVCAASGRDSFSFARYFALPAPSGLNPVCGITSHSSSGYRPDGSAFADRVMMWIGLKQDRISGREPDQSRVQPRIHRDSANASSPSIKASKYGKFYGPSALGCAVFSNSELKP